MTLRRRRGVRAPGRAGVESAAAAAARACLGGYENRKRFEWISIIESFVSGIVVGRFEPCGVGKTAQSSMRAPCAPSTTRNAYSSTMIITEMII
jgi:hypothetical protein